MLNGPTQNQGLGARGRRRRPRPRGGQLPHRLSSAQNQRLEIHLGVSVDQYAGAGRSAASTRFPSLEAGCERGGQAGNCELRL